MPDRVSLPIFADELRQDVLDRLGRIEGQVRGVARMVEGQRPCNEMLQQLASVQASL
jgi:DNA-binding FrmR family transcriptional regulator